MEQRGISISAWLTRELHETTQDPRKNNEPRRPCSLVGCPRITRWGKPYCTEHVHLNTHARYVILERLRIARRERRRAKKEQARDRGGVVQVPLVSEEALAS